MRRAAGSEQGLQGRHAPAPRRDLLEAVKDLVREAVAGSGLKREAIAARLGISWHTFEAWMRPGRADAPRADVLLRLLWDPSLLAEGPREALLRALCAGAGYSCVRLPGDGAGEELVAGCLAVQAGAGVVAGDVRAALADGVASARELRATAEDAERAGCEALGLAALCREAAERGGVRLGG